MDNTSFQKDISIQIPKAVRNGYSLLSPVISSYWQLNTNSCQRLITFGWQKLSVVFQLSDGQYKLSMVVNSWTTPMDNTSCQWLLTAGHLKQSDGQYQQSMIVNNWTPPAVR
jgi:hypothetical protein